MRHSGLLTDLYELTMAAGYVETRFDARATFELFVRNLPPQRNYLIAAGLEQALEFLENVRFTPQDIEYLRQLPVFHHVGQSFFDYLRNFRFTGDVWAMPEGTPFFPGEPVLRVTAPITEGQIVETFLLATISFQTLIASKAARVTSAARGRNVIEFGTRRAHGIESGVLAARAAFIGGCDGTSNVEAGRRFGIPLFGTQAHSWIMAHEEERQAFQQFLDVFPEHAVLLLDTYDVRGAVEKILGMGRRPRAVRLDSGDVAADSLWVRSRLDQAGWSDVQVFASGDLDEHRITELLASGARIDGFGVGTSLATSADAPALGAIYKLVELEHAGQVRNAAKFSEAKITYPGRKQVWRRADPAGTYGEDVIALEDEPVAHAQSLLISVIRDGKRTGSAPQLNDVRKRCLTAMGQLPPGIHSLESGATYPVRYSPRLEDLFQQVRHRVEKAAHS